MKRVLVVDPDAALRADLVHAVRGAGYRVEAATPETVPRALSECGADVVVLDVSEPARLQLLVRLRRAAPDVAVVAIGARPSLELAIEAMKLGARDFLKKPFDVAALEAALAASGPASAPPLLLTEDAGMRAVIGQAEAAAKSDVTLQLVGESGTGKDLLARFVHHCSPRSRGPFVVVDCPALHESLAESELFGHEAGAFTGATQRRVGQVRAANDGTLMLDHVSEAAPGIQPKLLRMLQEREVLPIGATRPAPFDARIVATAQRDLGELAADGSLRQDLYYRLDVVVLRIPPLRERPADLRLLARHFVERLAAANGCEPPRLSAAALARLERHAFRGNVRELENLMRRAVVLFPGREIDAERLLRGRGEPAPAPAGETLNLRELERRTIARSLERCSGNRTHAARALGISVRTLRNKIRDYQLA